MSCMLVSIVAMMTSITLDYQVPASEYLGDFDITLGINTSKLPKTQSKND